ncbi:MAG: hypothetical protein AAF432_07525 [Planctomycetota bacterium]
MNRLDLPIIHLRDERWADGARTTEWETWSCSRLKDQANRDVNEVLFVAESDESLIIRLSESNSRRIWSMLVGETTVPHLNLASVAEHHWVHVTYRMAQGIRYHDEKVVGNRSGVREDFVETLSGAASWSPSTRIVAFDHPDSALLMPWGTFAENCRAILDDGDDDNWIVYDGRGQTVLLFFYRQFFVVRTTHDKK